MKKRPWTFANQLFYMMAFIVTGIPAVLPGQSTPTVTPLLRITDQKGGQVNPMQLQSLTVDIVVIGQMATTTFDMVWYNRNPAIMEGEFEFPLSEGQTISGFALDIDGKMRQGVIVEKEKGRTVFEAIVRRQVDPGLLEVTAGNNYRARIYPLPAKGTRRIVISFEQELTPGKEADFYYLPLQINEKVAHYSLSAEVVKRPVQPLDTASKLNKLEFSQSGESQIAIFTRKDYTPNGVIALSFPRKMEQACKPAGMAGKDLQNRPITLRWWVSAGILFAGAGWMILLMVRRRRAGIAWIAIATLVMAGSAFLILTRVKPIRNDHDKASKVSDFHSWTARCGDSDSSWFYINAMPNTEQILKRMPDHVVLLWDVSESGKKRNMEQEKELLGALLGSYGDIEITLVPFHIAPEQSQKVKISGGNTSILTQMIDSLVYDGGSAAPDPSWIGVNCDEVLLFSDGLFNYRDVMIDGFKVPVHTICSSGAADYALMENLANSTGGSFINLNITKAEEAALTLTQRELRLISTQIVEGEMLSCFPSGSAVVGHTLSMAGTMKGDSIKLKLNFGYGSEVLFSEYLTVKAGGNNDPVLLQRIWAGKMLKELLWNPEKNQEQIVSAAQKYGFVTPFTSLIVLEELADYLQYKIVPPPELQKAYYAKYRQQVSAAELKEKDEVKARIAHLVAEMDDQTRWWETDFTPAPLPEKIHVEPAPHVDESPQVVPQQVTREDIGHDDTLTTRIVNNGVTYNYSPPTMNLSAANAVTAGSFFWTSSANASITSPVSYTQTQVGQVVEKTVLSASISLKPWNPKAPYLAKLREVPGAQKYKTYLTLKKQYHSSPAFYTDVAEYFRRIKSDELSLRILSNLAELELESPELLRMLGNKLMDYRQFPEAIYFFRKVLTFKGEDAQSSRDLGLALEAGGEYDEAVKTLYSVITGEIDQRFDGIKIIVMNDINRILAVHPQTSHRYIDKRLIRKEPVDVRVLLTWDLDDTDMDLWVTDPRGETCTYSNTLTEAGGKITRDITQGFGPEEFMIRKALKGTYTVKAHWYGSSRQDMLVPANLHVTFYTHHGRRQGRQKEITIRLEEKNEEITVGQFVFR